MGEEWEKAILQSALFSHYWEYLCEQIKTHSTTNGCREWEWGVVVFLPYRWTVISLPVSILMYMLYLKHTPRSKNDTKDVYVYVSITNFKKYTHFTTEEKF